MSSSEPWRKPRPAPSLDEVRQRVPHKSILPPWLHAWWPALLWSAVIFTASTDTFSSEHTASVFSAILHWFAPSLSDATFDTIHFFIRKSAHFTEYFIFYLLLYRGIRGARNGWHWSWAFAAWFIAAAYSALDEIHQSFVASRTASAWDSLLDSTGAFIALLILLLLYRLRHPRPST
ncbi:MAG: VanZ family protein [Candidatus Acidiferrales bacterium]